MGSHFVQQLTTLDLSLQVPLPLAFLPPSLIPIPSSQINAVGMAPEKASLALGGLGLTGLVSCIIGCFVFMERRESYSFIQL